jgi:hypothetical protein
MDFLAYESVSLLPKTGVGHICDNLNNLFNGIWYDTYRVHNTKWLWLISDLVQAINSDKIKCGAFGLYPAYVAGILNTVPYAHLYVVCSEKLHYEAYIQKCLPNKKYTITDTGDHFRICYQGEEFYIAFEERIVRENLPSELTFAYNVLSKIHISSVAYGIVSFNKRVTYITNEVLTSKHNCVYNLYAFKLDRPKDLANCKAQNTYCSVHPRKHRVYGTLFCTKQSHRRYWKPECDCKLCVKSAPASLKSLCVNSIAGSINPLSKMGV